MPNQSLTQKIAHNTIIQFSGKFIGVFLGVITIGIMTRYLGKIGFGQYSTIMAYLQIFAILIDLGLSMTIVRLISDPQHDEHKIVNNLFTIRFFSALIFLGLAPLLVIFFPYDNLIKIGVAVTTLSFFLSSIIQILLGVFQKKLDMSRVTLAEVLGRAVLLILVIIFAYLNYGLLAIMVAVVLGTLTNFILTYLFTLKYIKIKFAFDWPIWAKIWQVTWPIAVSIAFNLIYFKADTLILSLFRTQAEVGIYGAPYRVLEILINFVFMFMGLVLPILTLHWAQKNWEQFKKIWQNIFDFLIVISVPMVVGTMFLAQEIMVLIAGPEFIESGLVLQIIIWATAIIYINALFGYTIVVIEKQKQLVPAYIFVAIFSLIGYLILIPKYGYLGAAAFTVVSEILITTFNVIVTLKTIKYRPRLKIAGKSLLASFLMGIFLYLIPDLNIFLTITISGLIYFFFLFVFKGISINLIKEIFLIKKTSPKSTD